MTAPVFKQRWETCVDCGCTTIVVAEEDPAGVPDVDEWDRQQCLVCGGLLAFGNADDRTEADTWRMAYFALKRKTEAASSERILGVPMGDEL